MKRHGLTGDGGILRFLVVLSIPGSLLFSGCGEEEKESPGPEVVEASPSCTPDQDIIAEKRACTATDQCPCGSHCYLGRCTADCADDSECGEGQRCDMFGFCRGAGETDLLTLSVEPEGELEIEPASITVADGGGIQRITIRSGSSYSPIEEVRLVAEDGVELRCPGEDSFASECFLDGGLDAQGELIEIRATDTLEPGNSRIVRAFTGGSQRASVTYHLTVAPEERLMPGLYGGSARLVSAGTGTGIEVSDPNLNVQAELYAFPGGGGRLVLKESLGWLVPGGELVGELTGGESGVSLVVERFGWIEGEISEADPVEAQVDGIETPVRLGGATASTLAFALPYVFSGVLGTERPANATWQVTLTRQGELPADKAEEGPPAAAEPAAPATTVDPTSPTAWEEAVISTFPRWNQALALAIGDRDTIATCRSEGLDRLRASALAAGFEQVVQDAFENALPADAAITDWSFGELPDTFVTNSGIEIPDAVPCHLRFGNPEITPDEDCGAGILGPLLDDEDRCTDFETLFRCEVIDLETPVGEQGPNIDWSVQASEEGCGYSVDYTAEDAVEVRKVCRLPKVPHDCAEIALCHDHGSETADPVSSVLVEELPDTLPPLSGDLLCQAGPRGAVVEVDRRLETSDGTLRLTSQQMFEACAADLERLQTGVMGNTLQHLFQSQGCIDVVRRLFAMGAVAEVVHDPGPSKLRARAVMHLLASG